MKNEKSAIFIDAGYLNQIIKAYFNNTNVDFENLSKRLAELTKTEVLRTYYYHCKPYVRKGNVEDQDRMNKMEKFLNRLKRIPRYQVRLGRLIKVGNSFKQKMVDVHLSLDLVDMCFEKQIDHAIILGGDSDFVPAIERAKRAGAIIHLFYHPDCVHNLLLDHCDELYEINDDFIKEINRK